MTENQTSESEKTLPTEQWLVRNTRNVINGPFPKEEMRRMIRDGELMPDDEVCLANEHWFSLRDRHELLLGLGVELPPQRKRNGQEVTDTQFLPDETKTGEIPDLPSGWTGASGSVQAPRNSSKMKPIQVENPSVLKWVAWLLTLLVGIIVYLVLKLVH